MPFDQNRPLAFMHIPKTAGTALVSGLNTVLSPHRACSGFDRVLFGGFDDFASIHPGLRQSIHLSPDSMPAAADLIAGHISFASLSARYPSAQLMTLLREPICRLLSLWLFWRQHGDGVLAGWGDWADRVRLSRGTLAHFLSLPAIACQTDNVAVRMLLAPHPSIPPDDFIDPEHDNALAEEAGQRLAQFALVGIVEDPQLPRSLQDWFGHSVPWERLNELPGMPEGLRCPLPVALSAQAQVLLAARSRLDLQLWTRFAGLVLPEGDPAALRERTRRKTLARYEALMAA